MIGIRLSLFAAHSRGTPLWSPLLLGTSLVAWWSALQSSSITLVGSNVSAWSSIVGGVTVTQGTSANQPTYSSMALNGLPAVVGNGSSTYLRCASFTASAQFTVQVVAMTTTTALGTVISGGSPRMAEYIRLSGNGSPGIIVFHTDASSIGISGTSTSGVNMACVACSMVSPTTLSLRLNDGGLGTATLTKTPNSGVCQLDLLDFVGGTNRFAGALSDVIYVNRAVTTTERQKLAAYSAWSYGLQGSLDASNPYRSAPPRASLLEMEQWADEQRWRIIDLAANLERARRIYTPPRRLIVPDGGWRIAA